MPFHLCQERTCSDGRVAVFGPPRSFLASCKLHATLSKCGTKCDSLSMFCAVNYTQGLFEREQHLCSTSFTYPSYLSFHASHFLLCQCTMSTLFLPPVARSYSLSAFNSGCLDICGAGISLPSNPLNLYNIPVPLPRGTPGWRFSLC